MTAGSLAYVVNDGLIRAATEAGLDIYQAVFLRGCVMVAIFVAAITVRRDRVPRTVLTGPLVARVFAEVVSTATFFAALVHLQFANAQTILMLVPFAVTVVAAIALGEQVTRRGYAIVLLGFVGVVAVVRPTPDDFSPWSLLVIISALALVAREFATRRIESDIGPLPIASLTAASITVMTGVLAAFTGWENVSLRAALLVVLASTFLIGGYLFSIMTVRVGDLSVAAPFRYTAVIGAVAVGQIFFDETPDTLTVAGCAVIIAAGVTKSRV